MSLSSTSCVDCGVCSVVMLTQTVTIGRRVISFVLCSRCWIKRGAEIEESKQEQRA